MTEQLEALRKQQSELAAQIITLEDEARRAAEIKVGDYVQITKSITHDGQYGQIKSIDGITSSCPYNVRIFPYDRACYAYEVRRVSADEIRSFLHESSINLS